MTRFRKHTDAHGSQPKPSMFAKLKESIRHSVFGQSDGNGHGSSAPANPFGRALSNPDNVVDELSRHAIKLTPIVKRRVYEGLSGVPEGLRLGWAQLPQTRGRAFSLGMFIGDDRFAQIALADDRGRVFAGTDPTMDVQGAEIRFMFSKDGESRLPDHTRLGTGARAQASMGVRAGDFLRGVIGGERNGESEVDVLQGSIVGRGQDGRMMWLASWIKRNNRYTLEQLRAELDPQMRCDLEYRDAIAIAFFTAYLLPQMSGLLIGFGSGNIFRRLNREAPMGAIRRSVRDTLEARAHGLRSSGLEDYFSDLMREAGALQPVAGLEAVHGAEPLHLYTSSFSGSYFFSWDSSLEFSPALASLVIEGGLNRFAAVSAVLERNARVGQQPIEDNVTRAQAAQLDMALLNDPALIALRSDDRTPLDPLHDDGIAPLHTMMRIARDAAEQTAHDFPDPTGRAMTGAKDAAGSEWVYRQTLSLLLRSMRLPFRFDVDFRTNLHDGNVAIAFTTAGAAMMPKSRYSERRHDWVKLEEHERAAMSAAYNLRVGLMMAGTAFAVDTRVRQVSVTIDSIGLEEAVAEQDSAIAKLMGEALKAFERMRTQEPGAAMGGKSAPKDGDVHGDPSLASPKPGDGSHDAADSHVGEGRIPADGLSAQSSFEHGEGHGEGQDEGHGAPDNALKSAEEQEFEDLMQGADIDEAVFSVPQGNNERDGSGAESFTIADSGSTSSTLDAVNGAAGQDGSDGSDDRNSSLGQNEPDESNRIAGSAGIAGNAGNAHTGKRGDDPLEALRSNPTVRHMVAVTFSRDAFLGYVHNHGLNDPVTTYRMFDAVMSVDSDGALEPVDTDLDLRDAKFSPLASQQEPEFSEAHFGPQTSRVLGCTDATGLSIQRVDLLQRAVTDFHHLASDDSMPSVAKAQHAMRIVEHIGDPELSQLAPQVGAALIDGKDTPDFDFTLAKRLDAERVKARDLLFSGQPDQAIEVQEAAVSRVDALFAQSKGVPRYFNSYAERVVYNRLFATAGERTVLIPDSLFYAHMELADILSQVKGAKASLKHLNAMVSYAPAYPLSHMRLAVQLARDEDWDSARAACLNALRVALDRADAAFAYYRFAYSEWMRDRFDTAAAAYLMAAHIAPGQFSTLPAELDELMERTRSQCIPVPHDVVDAATVLTEHDLPVWPHTEVEPIVRQAARVCVDNGMFVPARTLSIADARLNDGQSDGIDMAQAQFLRSLDA